MRVFIVVARPVSYVVINILIMVTTVQRLILRH